MPKKGYKQSQECINKRVESRIGFKHSEETKKKIGLSNLGKQQSQETRRKAVETRMRQGSYKISDEQRKKISEHNPKYWLGKKFSEEHKKKLRDSSLKIPQEVKEKRAKKILEGLIKRPTSFEQKIADLCIENFLPFIYTGNGQFLINFKNPDFINEKDKIVIEVFYSWFKIRDYGSVENYKEFCRKKYNSVGWRVIFIDENEVDVENWKELCLNKIQDNCKEGKNGYIQR